MDTFQPRPALHAPQTIPQDNAEIQVLHPQPWLPQGTEQALATLPTRGTVAAPRARSWQEPVSLAQVEKQANQTAQD